MAKGAARLYPDLCWGRSSAVETQCKRKWQCCRILWNLVFTENGHAKPAPWLPAARSGILHFAYSADFWYW